MAQVDAPPLETPARTPDPVSIGDEHPDPVTLTEPEHDAQGLLRWTSIPTANGD